MKKYLIVIGIFVCIPQFVFAGSQTYSSPGIYTFTVPAYGSLTVEVWGAGGGGAAGGTLNWNNAQPGSAGGTSSFGSSISATGGGGGLPCTYSNSGNYYDRCDVTLDHAGGPGGQGQSGTTNQTGGTGISGWSHGSGNGGSGASGGAGGAGGPGGGTSKVGPPSPGISPGGGGGGGTAPLSGGGGGGGGGYAQKVFAQGNFVVGSSVSVVVGSGGSPGGGSSWSGASGASGKVTITWTDLPTCSLTLDDNPIQYGSRIKLRWSSSNADSFYITNVGYVNQNGNTWVEPSQTTTYNGTVNGPGGNGACSATLTVTSPSSPTATITADDNSIAVGESTMIRANFSAGSGDQLTGTNIDQPEGTGRAANDGPGASKSYQFTPSSPGTYTFYARAKTNYYTAWSTYATIVVSVEALPSCSLSVNPTSITQGGSSALLWSCTNATSCTGTNFSTGGATSGNTSVSPSQSTTYNGSCTGPGGSAPMSSGGATLTVTCTPAYFCSGSDLHYRDASCSSSLYQSCQYSCSGSACLPPPTPTGSLTVSPSLVISGGTTNVSWSTQNTSSCSVVSSAGHSWSGTSGGPIGVQIITLVTFTLTCQGLDGSTLTETKIASPTPTFLEF